MAKALLLNALHDALSDYVVGLSPEKLKVGVWSGKIVLEELQVRNHHIVQHAVKFRYNFPCRDVLQASYVPSTMKHSSS